VFIIWSLDETNRGDVVCLCPTKERAEYIKGLLEMERNFTDLSEPFPTYTVEKWEAWQ